MLVYLNLVETGMESQIESMGLNRVVMRQNLNASDYAGGIPEPDNGTYEALTASGNLMPVKFSFGRGSSNYGPLFAVGEYSHRALVSMAELEIKDSGNGVLFFSDSLPVGAPISVEFGGMSVHGFVSAMPGLLSIGGESNMVLLPSGYNPMLFQSGYINTTFFEKMADSVDIVSVVTQINTLHQMEYPAGSYPAAPVVTSAVRLAADLAAFRAKQTMLTGFLVAGVGGVIALVFGATAILEFRQSEFVCALLKSFGVGNNAILIQRLGESLAIANISFAGVLLLIPIARMAVDSELSILLDGFNWSAATPVLLCVNIGALIAIIPLTFSIRKPIGLVLS